MTVNIIVNKKNTLLWIKFMYSEKATNFCEISTVDVSYVVKVKSMVEISQNFMAFSFELYQKNNNNDKNYGQPKNHHLGNKTKSLT